MKIPRLLRVSALIVLPVVGLLLYADLQSIHQIFRVSERMSNDAPTPQARQALLENKNTRDREERRQKEFIEAALVVDVASFLWVGAGVLGWLRRTESRRIRARARGGGQRV
jgi:hypothetical protein